MKKKSLVIISGREKVVPETLIRVYEQRVRAVEKMIIYYHFKSIREWFRCCIEAGHSQNEIKKLMKGFGQWELVSPLGWAWLTQIYLSNFFFCPRSRVWQIQEKVSRDWKNSMISDKRASSL